MGTPLARTAGRPQPSPVSGSLADLPFANAEEAPEAVVFSRRVAGAGDLWKDVTAAEFAAEVADAAKGLIEAGLQPGMRIAIMSRTRYEWTLLDFAAWAAGAVVVPVYPTASAEQAAWAIRDSGVRAVIAEDESCARVIDDALNWSGVLIDPPRVWRLDEGGVEELMMRGGLVDDAALTRRRTALAPGSPATVVYTSGTTGMPKGVPLSHGNFLSAAANGTAMLQPLLERHRDPGSPPSTLLFLPLAHVLTRVLEVTCVQARIRLGHSPSVRAASLRPDLETFGATFLTGVPYVFERIHQLGRAEAKAHGLEAVYDHAARVAVRYARATLRARAGEGPGPSVSLRAAHGLYERLVYRQVRAALGGRIREAISGGSALPSDLMLFFAGAGIMIYEGYGLTETTGPATVNPAGCPRPGTVGTPLPGAEVRIAGDGEVLLRGPQVFSGYQPSIALSSADGTPESDAAGDSTAGDGAAGDVFDGGWFATGDLGRLDADGYLSITGRKKDILITRGGKNVSPGPLEDQLRAHPVISQCIVLGDDRKYVAALVTLDRAQFVLGALEDPGAAPSPDSAGSPGTPADGEVQVQSAFPVPPSVELGVARAVREVNAAVSRPESIRRVRIVEGDFTQARGLLSASLKIRRQAVMDAYRSDIEALYA
jgi:long-chain acyl-CoA synthetase